MNNFLIRTPVFSLEQLHDFFRSENPREYIFNLFGENKLFNESIYLNSRILHNQASKEFGKEANVDIKKNNKIANSLIRYFLRMCYRATPFGLSAGISIAEYSEQNENQKLNYNSRKARIDSSVISNILNEINLIKSIQNSIVFYTNNTLFKKDDFYRFFEKKILKNSFDFALVKVDSSDFLDEILKIGTTGLRLDDIRNFLKDDEDLEEEDIEDFIDELISTQMIVSELQYDVLNINFDKELLGRLEILNKEAKNTSVNEIILLLNKVLELIKKLESYELESEESLVTIIEIDSLLEQFNDSEATALQIDLIQETDFRLPIHIKNKIKENLQFFHKIDFELNKTNKLSVFKKEFLNRYGNRAVPLLEALDLDSGIGYPVNLLVNPNSSLLENIRIISKQPVSENKVGRWEEFLLDKYEAFLKNREKCIVLKNKDLDFIDAPVYKSSDSLLFSGQIIERTDGYQDYFVSAIKVGTAQYSAGRFAYSEKKIQEYINDVAKYEKEKLAESQIYAEIKHFSQPRLGNISNRLNSYDYYIPIYDTSQVPSDFEIPLTDLYIYIENDKVILYSKKLQKQIIPKLSCAQNTALLTCSIYNFLGELCEDYFMFIWNWGFLKNKFHLPRVQFDNFILSKERWLLNSKKIYTNSNDTEILKKYIKTNAIARYVTLSIGGDNFIPLDLDSEISISLLNDELVKNKIIILEESLNMTNANSVVTNDYGHITNEINIPIISEDCHNKQVVDLEKIKYSIQNSSESHFKLFPDKKSLYFKIYIKNDFVDKFFVEKLIHLISNLHSSNKFENFFFIRYIDPDYHLRLRFFSDNLDSNYLIESVNTIFKEEIASSIIDKIQIDTYERETERYGGELGIKISEKIFYYDSLCVLNILSWISANDKEADKWLIAMQGVHHLLKDFSISLDDRIKILEKIRDYYYNTVSNKSEVNKQIFSFYQTNRESIVANMIVENFEYNFFPFFNIRSSQNMELTKELVVNKIPFEVENYIHMFLNRFFESNQNQQELIIYDMLIRYYKTLLLKK